MEQLIITIEGKSNADLLMQLMLKFNFVKSVIRKKALDTKSGAVKVVNEPAGVPVVSEVELYNWINPTRPATDEEFEKLALEMEQDKEENSPEQVVNFVNKELKAWRKRKK